MDLNAIQTVVRPRVRAEIGAYARVASSPDCGGSWVLPRLVGFRRALEIALLSETFNAEEALRLGLVNWVVPRIELEARTAKLASRLASGPLFAQARIKRLMRTSLERTYVDQLDIEAESFSECSTTEDFSEALEAAARWIMAAKLWSVLSVRSAMRLNSLSGDAWRSQPWRCVH